MKQNFFFFKFRLHVRRGTKIISEAKAVNFGSYMTYAKDFYDKFFMVNADKVGKVNRTIYLVTEDLEVVKEALKK